ncbi:tissue factor pathway inhibitor 2 [Gadus chalcogrammus]|uniref:tissue factor pathway inhibitor 2 n=1 Tax=Gadus chalcogrammus TaxID=1042646 RepID=UPI0024C4A11E|nr:tissue factor pathway inhibitor 2 [Gadus chalcogrammus]
MSRIQTSLGLNLKQDSKMKRSLSLFTLLCSLQPVFSLLDNGVCLLQVDEGPCRALIPRYYYNTITQKCEEFHYGGCNGNANNFKSYKECLKTCYRIPKVPQMCRFPQEIGPCRALHKRYSFNMTTMQCEAFGYGGCQGNENRFLDLKVCNEYCSPHKTIPILCLDLLDRGKCAASIPRFYYKASSGTCEEFSYSGCGGSSNNFVSRRSCTDVCVKIPGHNNRQYNANRRRERRYRNNMVKDELA